MARNIVWPFACFSTQRIELPHKDQIHGSGLLACRACMLSVILSFSLSLFFLKLCLPLLLKQLGGGGKTPLEFTPVILGALSLQIEKPSYKNIDIFLNMIQLIEGLN